MSDKDRADDLRRQLETLAEDIKERNVIGEQLDKVVEGIRERNGIERKKLDVLVDMHRFIAAMSENVALIRDQVFPAEDDDEDTFINLDNAN